MESVSFRTISKRKRQTRNLSRGTFCTEIGSALAPIYFLVNWFIIFLNFIYLRKKFEKKTGKLNFDLEHTHMHTNCADILQNIYVSL